MQQRLHIAVGAGELYCVVEVGDDFGKLLVVALYQVAGLLLGDVQPVGQTEGRNAVDDAEVDGLGTAAHVGGHLVKRHTVNAGCRHSMDIETVFESVDHGRVAAHRRHDTQFHLRVVGRHDDRAGCGGREGLAQLLAACRADGDVLQIRVGGTESPRGRHRLVESGVDAACGRIHQLRQSVHVGGFQLRKTAPLQNQRHDGMPCRQLQQDFLTRLVLLGFGKFRILNDMQFLKKNFSQLFRRTDVEFFTRKIVNLLLQLLDLFANYPRTFGQNLLVEVNAVVFHLG